MSSKEKRPMRPALGLEKELVKDEISTALHTGVEKLEGKATPKQRVDNFHNTKFLLKQYRRVAYSVFISESELNLRMEMEHGISECPHRIRNGFHPSVHTAASAAGAGGVGYCSS